MKSIKSFFYLLLIVCLISLPVCAVPTIQGGVRVNATGGGGGSSYGIMNQTPNMTPGATGAAATIDVNATFTGSPGTNALVMNIGSVSTALLDFTIPSGVPGATDMSWNTSYPLLSGIRILTGIWNFGGYNASNLGNPVAAQDAITLAYYTAHGGEGNAINESYAYLPGRSGGQLLNGGIADNENLTLNATSNGVGNVLINSGGGFVGINTSTPTRTLTVNGTIYISNADLGEAGIQYKETKNIINNFENFGMIINPSGQKTNANYTQPMVSILGRLYLGSANTQNWTHNPYSMIGVEGSTETLSGSIGTITGAISLLAKSTFADAASVVNYYGVYIQNPEVHGNKLANAYGLYINSITGGASNNYAIYSAGGSNYFGGNVGVKTIIPKSDLDINGNMNVSGKSGFGIIPPIVTLDVNGTIYVRRPDATNKFGNISFDNIGLNIKSAAVGGYNLKFWTSDIERITILSDGKVGVATTSPTTGFQVGTTFYVNSTTGNVSIGSASSTTQLDITQFMRERGLGTGTLMSDANGVHYVISDEKMKIDIKPYTSGLKEILSIPSSAMITYKFKPESGLDTINEYSGFDAGKIQSAIPEAVSSKLDTQWVQVLKSKGNTTIEDVYDTVEVPKLNEKGEQTYTLSISDRPIIITLVNAVKEQQVKINNQQEQIDNLTARIVKLEMKVGVTK